MPFLRLLLAWIMMFAIPVQGFAAASMVFCGNPTGQHQAQAGQHSHPPGTPAHAHAPAANQDPWPGAPSQDHAQHQPDATPWAGVDSAKADAGNLTDQSHVCGVCASCCHAVAITPTPLVVLPDSPMQADLGEPLMAAYSRPSLVPDKPPRA